MTKGNKHKTFVCCSKYIQKILTMIYRLVSYYRQIQKGLVSISIKYSIVRRIRIIDLLKLIVHYCFIQYRIDNKDAH